MYIQLIDVYAETITSYCPKIGCKFVDKTFYADYPQGSDEYWRAYCNQLKDTNFECK